MNRTTDAGTRVRPTVSEETVRSLPAGPRLLAIVAGVLLMGSYLGVFYHVVDVVGGVGWFALSVGVVLSLATLFAGWGSVRRGLLLGGLLFAGGLLAYLLLVPSLYAEVFSFEFVVDWMSYLSGVSVLEFRRVGLWAIVVSPGPAFLSWFLVLTRRYDASAIVGGLMLGFFALTGDAGPTTTLVGMTSLLAMLGLGAVEREGGTVREVIRIGFVLALAVVVARSISVVPAGGGRATSGQGGSGDSEGLPLSGDLESTSERANVHESISLSPTVLFTIGSDAEADWRVAAYDRYTGDDWIRTGGAADYDGPLESPPGEVIGVEQTVAVERTVRTLPAAWKPIEVQGLASGDVQVTDHGGFTPARAFEPAETFRVRSAVPAVTADDLRAASGGDGEGGAGRGPDAYPPSISERYLQLPESTPERVRDLAEEVAGDAATPFEAVILVRRFLTSQKGYDLTVERPDGDVVEAFLFGMDRGYCVYFASSMVVLLRSLGIPARFVLGYTSGQQVGEDRWVVRGLDSHAWAEVYFPGHGWVGFDPTPAVDRRDARTDVLERARQEDVEGVDTAGSRDVSARSLDSSVDSIGGNATAAGDTNTTASADRLANASAGENASIVNARQGDDDSPAGREAGGDGSIVAWIEDRDRIALLAGAATAGIGLYWLGAVEGAYRTIRLKWQRPTDSPRRDVVRAYDRFELLLARRYRDRLPGETRRRYVEEVGVPGDFGRSHRLLELYERANYGDGVSRAEADEAIRLVDALVAADG